MDKNYFNTHSKTISSKDIAREAKCSTATVSRYFNGGYVSDEVKERIKECCDKFNFIPNQNAKSLKKKDNVIFIISQTTIQPRIEIIIQEINRLFIDKYFIYSTQVNYDTSYFKKTIMNIMSRNPENVVIFLPYDDPDLINFINSIKHFVFIVISPCKLIGSHHKRIEINNYDGFADLTYRLINHDKKTKIAFINRKPFESNYEMKSFTDRTNGFLDVVSKYNHVTYETSYIDNNGFAAQKEVYKLYQRGYRDFICATHTIFRSCIHDKRLVGCTFTDYGGKSLTVFPCCYKYKVFIDYVEIAREIANAIIDRKLKDISIITPIVKKGEC